MSEKQSPTPRLSLRAGAKTPNKTVILSAIVPASHRKQGRNNGAEVCLSPGPRLVKLADAANYLAVSSWVMRRLGWTRDVPQVKIRGRIYFDRQDLDRFIDEAKQPEA